MRHSTTCVVGIAALLVSCPCVSWGQIVRVGPGGAVSVRAPFVRVYVGPGGATSVRAPFTAVDVPGPWYDAPAGRYGVPNPRYRVPSSSYGHPDPWHSGRQPLRSLDTPAGPSLPPQRQHPTLADPSTLDWHALRRMLRTGAVQLDEQLEGISHGQRWKDYLETVTLRGLLPDEANVPPDSLAVDLIRDVLEKYDSLEASQQYGAITSLQGFISVHLALRELVLPPLERAERQLIRSAGELDRAVRGLKNGPGWASYLRLPDVVPSRASDVVADRPLFPEAQPEAQQGKNALFHTLIRYDEVSRDPENRVIAELPEFKAAHERLAGYVGLLFGTLSDDPSQDRGTEVLPAPAPETD